MVPDRVIEPPEVVEMVEQYVDQKLQEASMYDNRTPLDEDGVFSMHLLAARIYAAGFAAGETAQALRWSAGARRRARGDS